MKIKILIGILVLFFIVVLNFFVLTPSKPIPIPIAYPSQYNYQLEVNQSNKPDKKDMYVLFFTSSSCVPCIKMKKLVWSDDKVQESVGEYNSSPYMLNSSNHDYIDEFDRYSIKYVPTTIITNDEGEELKRSVGYMSVKQLLNFLD